MEWSEVLASIETPNCLITALMTGGERGYVKDLGGSVQIGVTEQEATRFSILHAIAFIEVWGLPEAKVIDDATAR